MQFYHGIINTFGINRFSSLREYDLQIKLFENIKKNSNNWKNEYMNLLFFELVPKFLTFTFSSVLMDTAIQRAFFGKLVEDGVTVSIESNGVMYE